MATEENIIGLNISSKQLARSQELSDAMIFRGMSLTRADMQKIPLSDASVDHVYSINALYHVNNPAAVIQESYRVLKRDGKLGIDDWFTTPETTPAQLNALRHNWSTGSNGFHQFDTFEKTIREAGFTVIDQLDFTQDAGNFLSESRFGVTYDSQIAPVLQRVFPRMYKYPGYEPAHALLAVQQLRGDIMYMGELYRNGQAVYRQVIAKK